MSNIKSVIITTLFVIFLALLIYGGYRIGPNVYKSVQIKHMSNEEVIEYVKDLSEDEYIGILNTVTKTQAERIYKLKVAYDLAVMEKQDIFKVH